jgi:predicted metal-dependent hydrolase
MAIAMSVDEPTAEQWADFVEAWVRAKMANAPRGHEASAQQVQAFFREYAATLSPTERAAFLQFARHEHMEPATRCAVVMRIYHAFATAAPHRAAPVFRAMMTGRIPWLPAA